MITKRDVPKPPTGFLFGWSDEAAGLSVTVENNANRGFHPMMYLLRAKVGIHGWGIEARTMSGAISEARVVAVKALEADRLRLRKEIEDKARADLQAVDERYGRDRDALETMLREEPEG